MPVSMGADQEKKEVAWIQSKDANMALPEDAGYQKLHHEMHQKELETSKDTAW